MAFHNRLEPESDYVGMLCERCFKKSLGNDEALAILLRLFPLACELRVAVAHHWDCALEWCSQLLSV